MCLVAIFLPSLLATVVLYSVDEIPKMVLSRFCDLVRLDSQGRQPSRRRRVPGRVPRRARRDQTSSGRRGGLVGAQSSVTVTGCVYIRRRGLPRVIRRAS